MLFNLSTFISPYPYIGPLSTLSTDVESHSATKLFDSHSFQYTCDVQYWIFQNATVNKYNWFYVFSSSWNARWKHMCALIVVHKQIRLWNTLSKYFQQSKCQISNDDMQGFIFLFNWWYQFFENYSHSPKTMQWITTVTEVLKTEIRISINSFTASDQQSSFTLRDNNPHNNLSLSKLKHFSLKLKPLWKTVHFIYSKLGNKKNKLQK